MPILQHELDINPGNLLSDESLLTDTSRNWWCLYTISRREKSLMRRMLTKRLAFYGPVAPKRFRSPAGRVRTSYVPLFPNYVFLFADDSGRLEVLQAILATPTGPIGRRGPRMKVRSAGHGCQPGAHA